LQNIVVVGLCTLVSAATSSYRTVMRVLFLRPTVTADVAHNETSSTPLDSAVARPLPLLVPSSSTAVDGASRSRRPIHRRSIRKTSVVGSSVVLNCDVPPPPPPVDERTRRRRPERMVKWHKQGVEVPIFIQVDRFPAHVDANYDDRARLLSDDDASLEVTDVRLTDAGWYECSVVYIDSTDDPNANGTWVYLAVTGQSNIFTHHKTISLSRHTCSSSASPCPQSNASFLTISHAMSFACPLQHTVFPLIEAGSQIQVGSLIEAGGGLRANTLPDW